MGESDDAVMPKSMALLWGLGEESGGRGPRRGLSLDQIVDAAMAVADADGYAALSMNRVAGQLGFTAMSLYRYVDSKQTLVELLFDRVIGSPPEIAPDTGWREGLRQWAMAEYAAISRHPWWLEIPIEHPALGPNNMAWLEAGLAVLADAPIPRHLGRRLVMNLTFYVIGRMRVARTLQISTFVDDDDDPDIWDRLLDPRRYPHVIEAFADSDADEEIAWHDADFVFGLERTLDGFEEYVRSHPQV